MSTSPSLYRRHRPRSFAEVVGQEHVVRTLSNAVNRGMVHHAYLFVGSRGTGKTSMAKILAACLNCAAGPTTEPCGSCESCTSIAQASSLDVIEMDAASSNSVDDIRALRESVAYAPVSGGQKVYILDEAHMLSTAAWNAFLKTLEEPPPNTVFVLATTEAQKVLPTVIDRCHRFDFQRPTADQIATVLRRTAAIEGIAVPPAAVALLARHAAGSFRDALGTLEQLRTYSGDQILLGDVLAVLGVADAELLFATLDAVAAGDPRAALLAVAGCVDAGRDPAGFIRELEIHAREALVVATLGGVVPAEIAITPERDEQLAEQAARIPAATLVRLLDLLAAALAALRAGADGRTQLELAVIKAAAPAVDASAEALLERIARLEAAASRGAPDPPLGRPGPTPVPALASAATNRQPTAAPPPASSATAHPSPQQQPPAPQADPDADPGAEPAVRPGPADRADSVVAARAVAATALASEPGREVIEDDRAAPGVIPSPPSTTAEPPAPLPPSAADPPPPPPVAGDRPPPPPAAAVDAPPPSTTALAAVAPELEGELTLERLTALWPAVLEAVGVANKMLAAVIADAIPVELGGRRLVLAFPEDSAFLRRKADDQANRHAVSEAVRRVTGRTLALAYDLRELSSTAQEPPAALSEEEWVVRLKAEFDAEELDG